MSDSPNLDAAIAGTGPKVPFTPTFTLADVAVAETRQLALIALIKTPKERALEIMEQVEQVATLAVPIAFPAAAPFVGVGKKALDYIEGIISRGNIDITEDTKGLLELYAEFNAAGKAVTDTELPNTTAADATLTTIKSDHTPTTGHHDTGGDHKPAKPPAHTPEGHHDTSNKKKT